STSSRRPSTSVRPSAASLPADALIGLCLSREDVRSGRPTRRPSRLLVQAQTLRHPIRESTAQVDVRCARLEGTVSTAPDGSEAKADPEVSDIPVLALPPAHDRCGTGCFS